MRIVSLSLSLYYFLHNDRKQYHKTNKLRFFSRKGEKIRMLCNGMPLCCCTNLNKMQIIKRRDESRKSPKLHKLAMKGLISGWLFFVFYECARPIILPCLFTPRQLGQLIQKKDNGGSIYSRPH